MLRREDDRVKKDVVLGNKFVMDNLATPPPAFPFIRVAAVKRK